MGIKIIKDKEYKKIIYLIFYKNIKNNKEIRNNYKI